MRPVVWVLNLDAELELRAHGRYVASRAVLARMALHLERLVGLVVEGDVVLPAGDVPPHAQGRAWCPTPSAVAALARAGL
ncbi:MAG: hypothetical protein AAGA56_30645, partial [Myxococcota bacterium]